MRTDLLLDRGERKIIAVTTQDVEPILQRNHALRNRSQPSRPRAAWCRHIATIPNVILVRWLNEEYARGNTQLGMFTGEFDELVAAKLRDPDWKFLRTDRG